MPSQPEGAKQLLQKVLKIRYAQSHDVCKLGLSTVALFNSSDNKLINNESKQHLNYVLSIRPIQEAAILMLTFICWLLLFLFCWPLAILALILWPLVWLVSLPFRIVGITFEAAFALLRTILFLPARILGYKP